MSTLTVLSSDDARRIALAKQFPNGINSVPGCKNNIADLIQQLGYIQIDTISVVCRAHHHTLWNRDHNYRAEILDELSSKDRKVFEYWGHAASYLPINDFRYYLPKMKAFYNPTSKWTKDRLDKYGHLFEPVLQRLKNEGPLGSRDFKNEEGPRRGTWWDWKPAKAALELLYWQGRIMVSSRINFQKVYDLTERVLPESIDTRYPSDEEMGRFYITRALDAYGVATEKEIRNHIFNSYKKVISESLNQMLEENQISQVKISGIDKEIYYSKSNSLNDPETSDLSSMVRILSPFDNLIIQRDRMIKLFNFDYSLECYVPAPKRKYGYFVLPILSNNRFIGRLDCKVVRKTGTLNIIIMHFESSVKEFDSYFESLAAEIVNFAKFNNCSKIRLFKTRPVQYRSTMNSFIKNLL